MEDDKKSSAHRADVHDEEKVWAPALEKTSPVSPLDEVVKPRAGTLSLFERVTYFLTRYGIETTGYDR